MLPILVIIFVILFAAAAIAFGIHSHKQVQARRDALAALATKLGFTFDPSNDSSHDDEYAHFEVFRRGHSRNAYNTLTGSVPIDNRPFPAKLGDFTYKVTSSNGKTTTTRTYRFSYMILHLPFPHTPSLLVRPEGIFDKLAGAIGFDDIDFESHEFSRRFCVKSDDRKFAYKVLDPRMMEWLLGQQPPPPVIDIERGRMLLADGRRRWEPPEFESRLAWAMQFLDRWPDHVTRELDTGIAADKRG